MDYYGLLIDQWKKSQWTHDLNGTCMRRSYVQNAHVKFMMSRGVHIKSIQSQRKRVVIQLTKMAFFCSMPSIEVLEQDMKYVQNKIPEQGHLRRSLNILCSVFQYSNIASKCRLGTLRQILLKHQRKITLKYSIFSMQLKF